MKKIILLLIILISLCSFVNADVQVTDRMGISESEGTFIPSTFLERLGFVPFATIVSGETKPSGWVCEVYKGQQNFANKYSTSQIVSVGNACSSNSMVIVFKCLDGSACTNLYKEATGFKNNGVNPSFTNWNPDYYYAYKCWDCNTGQATAEEPVWAYCSDNLCHQCLTTANLYPNCLEKGYYSSFPTGTPNSCDVWGKTIIGTKSYSTRSECEIANGVRPDPTPTDPNAYNTAKACEDSGGICGDANCFWLDTSLYQPSTTYSCSDNAYTKTCCVKKDGGTTTTTIPSGTTTTTIPTKKCTEYKIENECILNPSCTWIPFNEWRVLLFFEGETNVCTMKSQAVKINRLNDVTDKQLAESTCFKDNNCDNNDCRKIDRLIEDGYLKEEKSDFLDNIQLVDVGAGILKGIGEVIGGVILKKERIEPTGLCVEEPEEDGGKTDIWSTINPCNFGKSILEGFKVKQAKDYGCLAGWLLVIFGFALLIKMFGGRK